MPQRPPARSIAPKKRAAAPHQVRIIAGIWKRTPLPILDTAGLRPTPSRVRETIFSWLTHLLADNWESVICLDLFAGSGALGFEAASRGAMRTVLVEQHGAVARQLEAMQRRLDAQHLEVLCGDAPTIVQRLQTSGERFDLIFLDPPYALDWLRRILPACANLLSEGGIVYAEAEHALCGDNPPDWMRDWEVIRSGKAGQVFFHLLRRLSTVEIQA